MTQPPVDERPNEKRAGINRSHDPSFLPKVGFCLLHLGSVLLCVYVVWGTGMQTLGGWIGQTWTVTDPVRGQLLEDGVYPSRAALARAEGVSRAVVTQGVGAWLGVLT